MKKRAFVGSVVVVAVVLTTFFTGIIPGFGRGSSDGEGTAATAVQAETTGEEPAKPAAVDSETDPARPIPPAPAAAVGPPPEVVQVVVEHDRIGLQIADGRYKVAPVSEVVEIALKATGNEDGIKVRILRKASAKVVTWSMLRSELENAGIASSSILIPKKLVD